MHFQARDLRHLDVRARADHHVLPGEPPPAGLDRPGVDDLGPRIQHELDIQLLLGLPVHEGVRVRPAVPEKLDHFQDAGLAGIPVREEEPAGIPAPQIHLGGNVGKEMVRNAGLMRA